jgi:Holliday junction resolvase RusA-like endonuclease
MKFTVYGPPAAQGSKSYAISKAGKVFGREASKRVMPFRQACAGAAVSAGARIVNGPVRLSIMVYAVRPASHRRANGGLAKDAPTKPGGHDASKVGRSVEDALAGICYRNDRAVRTLFVDFNYDDGPERVEVEVTPCDSAAFGSTPSSAAWCIAGQLRTRMLFGRGVDDSGPDRSQASASSITDRLVEGCGDRVRPRLAGLAGEPQQPFVGHARNPSPRPASRPRARGLFSRSMRRRISPHPRG